MKIRTMLAFALPALIGFVAFSRYALIMTFAGGFASGRNAESAVTDATSALAISGVAAGIVACALAVWQLQRLFSHGTAFPRRQRSLAFPPVVSSS